MKPATPKLIIRDESVHDSFGATFKWTSTLFNICLKLMIYMRNFSETTTTKQIVVNTVLLSLFLLDFSNNDNGNCQITTARVPSKLLRGKQKLSLEFVHANRKSAAGSCASRRIVTLGSSDR